MMPFAATNALLGYTLRRCHQAFMLQEFSHEYPSFY